MKRNRDRVFSIFLAAVFFLVLGSTHVLSQGLMEELQAWEWELLGPSGGNISTIVAHPHNSQEIYIMVSSIRSTIYKTKNQGWSWTKIACLNRYGRDMVIDPNNPDTFYVISYSRILTSSDAGKNWETIDLGNSSYFNHIAIDPANPSSIFITGSYGPDKKMAVFKTKNAGKTWTRKVINSAINQGETSAIAVSPSNPNNILVSGYHSVGSESYYQLLRTTDAGNTWGEITLPYNTEVKDVAFDPVSSQRIYFATDWGVFHSTDGGQSWIKNEESVYGYSLIINPSNPNNLYLGGEASVYASWDGGNLWTRRTQGLRGACNQIAIIGSSLYFGSSLGFYKSMDDGFSWKPAHRGIGNLNITLLEVSKSSPNVIYARGEASGLFKSTDSAKTWVNLEVSMGCDNIQDFALDPQDAQKIFAFSGG